MVSVQMVNSANGLRRSDCCVLPSEYSNQLTYSPGWMVGGRIPLAFLSARLADQNADIADIKLFVGPFVHLSGRKIWTRPENRM